ncbi:unnamed protein product, partial [Polarella glacialis]
MALTRPPGHHSSQDRAAGFCLYNSVAIAARQALKSPSIERVLILDLDVHHGDGTQAIFYENPSVLTISLHAQELLVSDGAGGKEIGLFPEAGLEDRCGSGAGLGKNVNVPLRYIPGGYGDQDYLALLEKLVLPVCSEFSPDLVLVAAGFDCCEGDPSGAGFRISGPGFFGPAMRRLRECLAGGRLCLALEGGYAVEGLCGGLQACLEAMLGESSGRSLLALDEPRPEVAATIQ